MANHDDVWAEVRRFELETIPFDVDRGERWFHAKGEKYAAAQLPDLIRRHFSTLPTNLTADVMLDELFRRRAEYVDSGGFAALLRQLYGVDGERLFDLLEPTYMSNADLWSTLDISVPPTSEMPQDAPQRGGAAHAIVGGWSRVTRALADDIAKRGGEIRTSHLVRSVDERTIDGEQLFEVRASVVNGTAPFRSVTVRARAVVFASTVPAPELRTLKLTAALLDGVEYRGGAISHAEAMGLYETRCDLGVRGNRELHAGGLATKVVEMAAFGIPTIVNPIDVNIDMLGADYPYYWPYNDSVAALTALLVRAATDADEFDNAAMQAMRSATPFTFDVC
jgi:hypothetical protein